MYYKSVNRGLSFTRPGLYMFGLVLFVGLAAVATGVNGLFVFLSVGLGGFIISGLLSERSMRSATVVSVSAALTDAEAPFEVVFRIQNHSDWFTVYSMRAMFMLKAPKFRLIATEMPNIASVRLTRVPAGATQTYSVMSSGMPRGDYRQILATQLTTFPFGILEKFKLASVPASLIVAPAVDHGYLEMVREDLKRRLLAGDADREFYAHKPYTARESLRQVDWKKSAGRPSQDWVVRLYRAPAGELPIRVFAPWSEITAKTTAAAYEGHLAKIRTVLKALDEARRAYTLDLGAAGTAATREHALGLLAALPPFEARARPLPGRGVSEVEGPTLRLQDSGVAWEAPRARRAGGRP